MRPAAGPPTTRTWPSSITRTAGTKWRSCRPRAAAAWARQLCLDGGSGKVGGVGVFDGLWGQGDSKKTSLLAGSLVISVNEEFHS